MQEDLEEEMDEQMEQELIFSAYDMMTEVSKSLKSDMLPFFENICNVIAPYQVRFR
jgi:hypothetical protein